MLSLLIYSLRVAVVMAVFYLFYRLLLSRETFHRLNRVVLLVTALLSFVLPLCIITITHTVEVDAFEIDSLGTATDANLYITTQQIAESASLHLIALIFGVGVLAVLAWNVVSIISLRRLVRSGRTVELYGEQVTVVGQAITPLSWFRHIVLSEQDAEECGDMVVAHEKAHIALHHSWDLVLVNLCCAVQWFNPAMWLLRSDLKDIHEFEADAEVLRSGIDARSYQILLIKKTVGNKSYSIANSLNHSTLKKRITMMLSKKSSAASRWKLLYTLPVVALSLTAFAEQRTNLVVRDDSDNKVTQNSQSVNNTQWNLSNVVPPIVDYMHFANNFGEQTDPQTGAIINHKGIDIVAKKGTPVYAIADGRVVVSGKGTLSEGERVMLEHEDGVLSFYYHLDKAMAKEGAEVKVGEQIGTVGQTGDATGPHLHFEMRHNGTSIDPTILFPQESGNYVVFTEKDGRDTMNVRLSLEITDDGGQLFTGSQSALKAFSAHFAGENAIYMDLDKIYEGAEDVDAKDLTIYGPEGSAVISVDFEGNYQLNGKPSSLKAIGKQLAKWRGTPDEPKSILISAWKDCPVDYTVALKEVLRENGQLRITTIYQEDFDISFEGVEGALYKISVDSKADW
ncbi:MAG: peptidoglycan DD-metalloendopeptidase family protein [Tidjanibacter sp.]|nr:peptidoglycan DD-metalloendopeptidase family protein [Tidjanibacter sp.]